MLCILLKISHMISLLSLQTNLRVVFQTLGNEVNVTLYSPPLPEFDYSMVVIFLIAVFTVALGGYWSGVAEL